MNLQNSTCSPVLVAVAATTFLLAGGCRQEKAASAPAAQSQEMVNPGKPVAVPAAAADPARSGGFSGTVTETMDAGGYTYVQVDTGKELIWAAGPTAQVKVGSKVTIPEGAAMNDFHSKTLNRDFKVIYFVGAIGGGAPAEGGPTAAVKTPTALPPGHPPVTGAASAAGAVEPPVTGIAKAENGQTVAEVYAGKADLAGKPVTVRGKVVKVNSGIMGKNWLHLRDGSGEAGTNDLTVTTAATAKKGDVVVVTGTVAADKDFGAGYKYSVLIEDAKVTAEVP